MSYEKKIRNWLLNQNKAVSTLYIGLIAFLTYACMYGLRKPFTVAEFQGLAFWGMDFKALLIISQVIGYAQSKFIGIKVISEMKRHSRANSIIILTSISECSLILFSFAKPPYNIIFMFFNGLPLGMIWGLVFSYLEGRRNTEILGTILSISFIVSSGFVKSVGQILMNFLHLNDFQMPCVTGMIFYIPLILLVRMLDQTPDPTAEDEFYRTRRVPMDKKQRKTVFSEYAVGLILLILAYVLLTIYRDLRDNFAADIWKSIGFSGNSMIFTWSELPIALLVFAVMSSMMFITNNKKAFISNSYIILTGFIIIGLSTLALNAGLINPAVWMISLGLGTYLGYLPYNCLLFDRMIAAFGSVANAGFFIYIADSFGYIGSIGALLFKNFSSRDISWFRFLVTSSYGMAISGSLLIIFSIWYFSFKFNTDLKRDINIKDLEINTLTV